MNDEVERHTVEERIPTLEGKKMFRWPRFLLESVLAIGSSLAVTGLIGLFSRSGSLLVIEECVIE